MSAPLPRSLHIIGGKGLGGAERFCIRLVNALARHGAPVAAITVAGGEIARAIDTTIPHYHAPMLGGWDVYSRWRILRHIADFQPDIVQTYMGRATRMLHLARGQKPVHIARLGGFYNLKSYRHAHAWVGNTQGILDYLVNQGGLPAERAFHIGNFVDTPARVNPADLDALRAQLGLSGSRVVLGLGRLHPNKGWQDLLQAFARLPEVIEDQPLRLLMVGDGPERAALAALSDQLGISTRVHWAGWQVDPAPYYQLADVFVCASVHEPLGNVILEAWVNKALLVSTRAQGPLELVQDGVNGLLTPLADPGTLASTLLTALNLDTAGREKLLNAGWETLMAQHSESAVVGAYLALYADLRDR